MGFRLKSCRVLMGSLDSVNQFDEPKKIPVLFSDVCKDLNTKKKFAYDSLNKIPPHIHRLVERPDYFFIKFLLFDSVPRLLLVINDF